MNFIVKMYIELRINMYFYVDYHSKLPVELIGNLLQISSFSDYYVHFLFNIYLMRAFIPFTASMYIFFTK